MNTIKYECPITRLTQYPNSLGIQCQDSLFPGKIAKITTNIIGDNREKWQDKLMEGDIISIQGNIAEVKQNSYGAYIIVYNPEILGARRIRSEAIELDEDDVIESNEQE